MPNLGVAEIVAILVVALVVLGPKRLPEVGRKIGGFVRQMRTHSESVKAELRDVIDIDGVADSVNSVRRDLKEATNISSIFTETTSSTARTSPAAAPPPADTAPVGDLAHPMMRALGSGPVDAQAHPTLAQAGPTRRLPGATAPAGGSTGNGDGPGAAPASGEVTRRLPRAQDEA